MLITLGLVLAVMVALAAPALAHTEFQDSTPANGARLSEAPREIVLRFSDRVDVASGAVTVLDAKGKAVPLGPIGHPPGQPAVVTVGLPRLDAGAYVVSWRVVSADSHPIQGALTFTVGEAEPLESDEVAQLRMEPTGSEPVALAYGVSRALAFASMLVLLGGVAFVVLLWPAGASNRRFRRIAWTALALLALSSTTNLLLQGGYAAGLDIGGTLSASTVSDVLRTRFGRVYELRFALIAVSAVLLWLLGRHQPLRAWWRWSALVVGVALAATPGLAGHAAVGSHQPYALIADVLHVGAAAVWLGGLVVVLAIVLREADATDVLPRYSRLAFYAVVVVVATGTFQSWRQVGSIDALRTTDFGKALTIKLVLVGAVLVVASLSRRVVRRGWDPASRSRVRATVAVEAVLAVAVLGVTSLLVNAVPARSAVAAPQSGELTSPALIVDYTLSPARVGRNEIHLYALTKEGQPRQVQEMSLTLRMKGSGVAPIEVDLQNAGTGHFRSSRLNIPFKGRWTIAVDVRTSGGGAERLAGGVDVR